MTLELERRDTLYHPLLFLLVEYRDSRTQDLDRGAHQ